ncbi:MAG: NAD-dependent epimerase/dehydratase family protein [Planctomycetes bacterium]|nr:NAD-dependent epimerase/dehydratase family protein [Planctomycetota bacterium]
MATYIVTGAAGFIGSHLSASLVADGHEVVGIDNFDPFYDRGAKEANLHRCTGDGFRLVEADICDGARMTEVLSAARPEAVFHIAALAGVRPSVADPVRFARVNVEGLVAMLEATRASGCRRVVFASSSSVYGERGQGSFNEADEVSAPISPYAATKRAGELLCSAWCHLHGLSVAAMRLFTVFGPSQRPDLAIGLFMRRIAAGEDVPMFGDGTSSRDYTYVGDIVRGLRSARAALAECEPGFFRIWNLGGSRPVALADLIDRIGRVVGNTPRVRQLPLQPGDVPRTCADLSRSEAELGWTPEVELDDGLRRQWEWVRA